MIWRWEERRKAERWAKSATEVDERPSDQATDSGPSQSPPGLTDLSDPFVVRLLQLLRDQGPAVKALDHLEDELTRRGSEPNEVLRREQSRQAANQVTVGNCVLSLRLLSAVDWNAFFEQTSHVEAVLREDPSGIYPRQDFATSDRYRRAVEMIARGSKADEIEVARRVVEMARRDHGSSEPLDHVGFYLIDRGQRELKAAFGYRPGWRERLLDGVRGRPEWVYFGSIALCLGALMALVVALALGGVLQLVVGRSPRRGLAAPALRAGGWHGQPGVDLVPAASCSAQARREGWHRDRARDLRRHPIDAGAAGERGGAAGTAGAPLPGQPRPEPPIRPAHRLHRRSSRGDASR